MGSAEFVSLEEYFRHPGKPACEYADGVLRSRSMPTKRHGLTQFLLVKALRLQGIDALGEVWVQLSERRVLVPDVIAAENIRNPFPMEPVTLCGEVLSADESLSAVFAKCEEYHSWGVPYCWILDPERQLAWEYHSGGVPVAAELTGVLRAGALVVGLDEIFGPLSAEL